MTTLRLEFNHNGSPRATRAPLRSARYRTLTFQAGGFLPGGDKSLWIASERLSSCPVRGRTK